MYNSTSYLQKGLGFTPLPASVVNYQIPIPASPTPTAPTGNFWTSASNFFSNVNKVASQAAPLVTQVKQTADMLQNRNTIPNYNNAGYAQGSFNPYPQPMSTTKKVLIGAGILGAAFLVYHVLKPGKKKGLGEIPKVYYVTYTKKNGGDGVVMVKATSKDDALRNASYSVFTGKDFRNATETNDRYVKPTKQGYQGSQRQN